MKFLNTVLVIISGLTIYTTTAFGQSRLEGLVGERCNEMQELTPQECAISQQDAAAQGCVTEAERAWLSSKSYSIFCLRTEPMFVCPCSCFDNDVKILTGSFEDPTWTRADKIDVQTEIVTLSASSSLELLDFETNEIDYTTSGPEKPMLYQLHLDSGKSLAVTQHHALLLNSGLVTTAKEVEVGDELMGMQGEKVEVLSISLKAANDGRVYNFRVNSSEVLEHFVVAEGVVVGDTMFQGSWYDLISTKVID